MNERDQFLIDGQLQGTLAGADTAEFEIRMTDILFREVFHAHQDLQVAFRSEQREIHKKHIQSWDEASQSPPEKKLSRRWYAAAAAAVVLLIGVFSLFGRPSPAELFQTYYQYFPDMISEVSRSTPGSDGRATLMDGYNRQNWEAAVQQLGTYSKDHPADHTVRLYYGLSLLHTDVTTAASELAIVEEQSADPDIRSAAQWYYALALIKAEHLDDASRLLQEIAGSDHYQNRKANEILESLK